MASAESRRPTFSVSRQLVRRVRGFTLVELTTVVGIVGVLASIAVPAYHQYIVRARVVEALVMGGHAKTAVSELIYTGRANPAGYATLVAPVSTTNVASLTIDPATGVVTVVTTARAAAGSIVFSPYTGINSPLPDGTAPFIPPSGTINWQCMTATSTPIVPGVAPGTLQARYAPASCR